MNTQITRPSALLCLTHPLTLAAIGLVLLNDLVLRRIWPSAWTDKLSDLGVLFFLPLLLTALLGLALPRRERLAGGLAFGTVLAAFLLLKAAPESNRWLTALLPVRAVPDPSDLLVLPAWAAALALWLRPARPGFIPLRAWLILPLAALVTLGDAAMPSYGARCISVLADGSLSLSLNISAMQSRDGGRTWQPTNNAAEPDCGYPEPGTPVVLASPRGTQYRLTIGQKIERSLDGQNWETLYTSTQVNEAELAYRHKTIPVSFFYLPAPLDGIIDPASGSLVAGMGLEGVLLVPESGPPLWAAVSVYHHEALKSAGLPGYLSLLSGEITLAAAAALLWLATALLRLRRSLWQAILTGLGWLVIAIAIYVLEPSLANGSYTAPFVGLGLAFAFLWALALVITALVRARKLARGPILRRALLAVGLMLLLLLPYAAWSLAVLPSYWIAQLTAAGLAGAAAAASAPWKTTPQP